MARVFCRGIAAYALLPKRLVEVHRPLPGGGMQAVWALNHQFKVPQEWLEVARQHPNEYEIQVLCLQLNDARALRLHWPLGCAMAINGINYRVYGRTASTMLGPNAREVAASVGNLVGMGEFPAFADSQTRVEPCVPFICRFYCLSVIYSCCRHEPLGGAVHGPAPLRGICGAGVAAQHGRSQGADEAAALPPGRGRARQGAGDDNCMICFIYLGVSAGGQAGAA